MSSRGYRNGLTCVHSLPKHACLYFFFMSPPHIRSSGKRAPTTPLTDGTQNKRTVYSKPETVRFTPPKLMDVPSNPQLQLVDARYKMWLMEQLLGKQKDMTKFLELEREFAMEA